MGTSPRVGSEDVNDGERMLITPAGREDPEYDCTGLQGRLCEIADTACLDQILVLYGHEHDSQAARRLRDLRDPATSHTWLWAINRAHGEFLEAYEYGICVRIRLGLILTEALVLCECCGADLDVKGIHCLNCAPGRSTHGHNEVRDVILKAALLGDSIACSEPGGLIPSDPLLRPADVLTTAALPGRSAALDLGVASPFAAGAGDDYCDTMHQRKMAKYEPYFEELAMEGIHYVPVIFSAFGRPHPQASVVMNNLASIAARKRGISDVEAIRRRLETWIGVRLQKRLAAMVINCLPQGTSEDIDALFTVDCETGDDAPTNLIRSCVEVRRSDG